MKKLKENSEIEGLPFFEGLISETVILTNKHLQLWELSKEVS
jgi:hypothetical protein